MDSMPPVRHDALEGPVKSYGAIARFAPGEIQDLLSISLTKAREDAARNRARVLAHPDLAKRLTEHPLNLPNPEMWNGYIPPRQIPTSAGYRLNTSPQRAALLQLIDAAAERENQQ